jgi:hypothetical protein
MAQLKEDEWPGDGEPTTAEQEGDRFKQEGSDRPRPATRSDDRVDRAGEKWVIDRLEADQPGD